MPSPAKSDTAALLCAQAIEGMTDFDVFCDLMKSIDFAHEPGLGPDDE